MNGETKMNDFYPNSLKLNKKAQQVITRIDESLALYRIRNKRPKMIHLYKAQYTTLNDALLNASNKGISLKTHTYNGVSLESM